jgi:hypothetical protein
MDFFIELVKYMFKWLSSKIKKRRNALTFLLHHVVDAKLVIAIYQPILRTLQKSKMV